MDITQMNIPHLRTYERPSFFLIAGPCVVENKELLHHTAPHIAATCEKLGIPFVFKSSYRKANRTKSSSFQGIGDTKALELLAEVRETFRLPVLTDIHLPEEAATAAAYTDVLQIPAFLCRQTDLLEAAAATGKPVNIKKGQFLSAQSMQFAAEKISEAGNPRVMLTERGNTFGYSDLVVDMRNIPLMQQFGVPVVMDVTHSLQQPNTGSGVTGGMPEMIDTIASAAIAAGCNGLFIETHPNPKAALSDGANMLPLEQLESLLKKLKKIYEAVHS
jgi:2-dehydro-3-deoxyphosphooctonate aldolase (KDO 8-P synthase)